MINHPAIGDLRVMDIPDIPSMSLEFSMFFFSHQFDSMASIGPRVNISGFPKGLFCWKPPFSCFRERHGLEAWAAKKKLPNLRRQRQQQQQQQQQQQCPHVLFLLLLLGDSLASHVVLEMTTWAPDLVMQHRTCVDDLPVTCGYMWMMSAVMCLKIVWAIFMMVKPCKSPPTSSGLLKVKVDDIIFILMYPYRIIHIDVH